MLTVPHTVVAPNSQLQSHPTRLYLTPGLPVLFVWTVMYEMTVHNIFMLFYYRNNYCIENTLYS